MLRSAGVTHVLAQRVRFLKKSYPFLTDAEFEAAFVAPAQRLEAELLEDGVLVYEEGRYGVWRIHGP